MVSMRPLAPAAKTVQKVTGSTRCIAAKVAGGQVRRCRCRPARLLTTGAARRAAVRAAHGPAFHCKSRVITSYEVTTWASRAHPDNPLRMNTAAATPPAARAGDAATGPLPPLAADLPPSVGAFHYTRFAPSLPPLVPGRRSRPASGRDRRRRPGRPGARARPREPWRAQRGARGRRHGLRRQPRDLHLAPQPGDRRAPRRAAGLPGEGPALDRRAQLLQDRGGVPLRDAARRAAEAAADDQSRAVLHRAVPAGRDRPAQRRGAGPDRRPLGHAS